MKKKPTTPRDLNQLAAFIADRATSESKPDEPEQPQENPAAVEFSRLGGMKGVKKVIGGGQSNQGARKITLLFEFSAAIPHRYALVVEQGFLRLDTSLFIAINGVWPDEERK